MRDNVSHMGLAVIWNGDIIPIEVVYSDRRRSWAIEVKTTGEVLIRVPTAVSFTGDRTEQSRVDRKTAGSVSKQGHKTQKLQ